MIWKLLESSRSRPLDNHVRLDCVTLEARLTPTGAEAALIVAPIPIVVTVAPPPATVSPPASSASESDVRTDLFGHAEAPVEEADVDAVESDGTVDPETIDEW